MRNTIAISAFVSFVVTIVFGTIVISVTRRPNAPQLTMPANPPRTKTAPSHASLVENVLDETTLRLGELCYIDSPELRRKILHLPAHQFLSTSRSEEDRLAAAARWVEHEKFIVPEVSTGITLWLTNPVDVIDMQITNVSGARYRVEARHDRVVTFIRVKFVGNDKWD